MPMHTIVIVNRLFEWSQNFVTRELTELNELGVPMTIAARDMAQRTDDTVQERLAADKASAGAHFGLPRQMFAAAKADFEFERAIIAKQCARIERPFRHRQPGQQILDQRRLPLAQLMPRAPPVKPTDCDGIAHYQLLRSGGHAVTVTDALASTSIS